MTYCQQKANESRGESRKYDRLASRLSPGMGIQASDSCGLASADAVCAPKNPIEIGQRSRHGGLSDRQLPVCAGDRTLSNDFEDAVDARRLWSRLQRSSSPALSGWQLPLCHVAAFDGKPTCCSRRMTREASRRASRAAIPSLDAQGPSGPGGTGARVAVAETCSKYLVERLLQQIHLPFVRIVDEADAQDAVFGGQAKRL